jgi:hypothetical protein
VVALQRDVQSSSTNLDSWKEVRYGERFQQPV